ncbi:MAG: L-threonylcarbamoyladenylate synthase [Euryarchaeota archaeon]|nr:L-threonylcarbamoyladenylate synthase [Euryarchaeota archaeon]
MESNHADLQKTRTGAPGKVADIHAAAKIIRDRGVVIYPTETVYGIGADALSVTAVKKVFAIKKRPSPVSLAVSGYEMIEDVSVCDTGTMELIRKLLPGPITVILKKKPVVPDILTAGSDRVGIRYPDHETTIRLIDLSGTPVTSTSANLPGESPAREVCEISADVLGGADCVLDGGRCVYGVASTVVDLVDMQILRKGVGYEQVARYLR